MELITKVRGRHTMSKILKECLVLLLQVKETPLKLCDANILLFDLLLEELVLLSDMQYISL